MTKDEKSKVYSIRKSLSDNELPTKKTVFWMLELIDSEVRGNEILQRLLDDQRKENVSLVSRIKKMKDAVIASVERVFDI